MLTKLSIMLILAAVATNTTSWFCADLIDSGGMTAMTMDIFMLSIDFELGLLVVIKTPDIPAVW